MAQKISDLQMGGGDKVTVFGRNLEVTSSMREHIIAKIKKIEEMTPPVIGVHVYLDIQREDHHVEIEYKFSHFRIVVSHVHIKRSQAKMDNMYHAIDIACDKLKRKVRRWKTRIQDHHGKKPQEIEERSVQVLDQKIAYLEEINEQIEDETVKKLEEEFRPPQVVRHKKRQIPMLTMEEATMRIDLSGDSFLIYREQEDQKLRVMYMRRDHTLGVLDIE